MSTEVCIEDQDSFNRALMDVRADDTQTNWALFGHVEDNPNMLCLLNSGPGGLEEMADQLMDSQMHYALVRLEETIDMSTTIKFVYIRWSGSDVAFTKKGKYGVVHGSIEKLFTPYHCSVETDSHDELTEEYIMTKLQEQSGMKSKVLEATVAKTRPERGFTSGTTTKMDSTGTTPTQSSHVSKIGKMGSSFAGMTGMAKSSGGVRADQEVVEAIESVRDDTNEDVTWCAVGYGDNNPKNPLVVKETGKALEDFTKLCTDDTIVYGLVRVTDLVDDIPTVKFAYIQWMGEGVKPMTKAKMSTHKGALENHFKPFHVSIFATLPSEVSTRVIMDKVMSASGSKINIKA